MSKDERELPRRSADDKQREHRSAPSNLFVMHGVRVSKVLLRTRRS